MMKLWRLLFLTAITVASACETGPPPGSSTARAPASSIPAPVSGDAARAFMALPRLVSSGTVLRLETGERWTAIEASDFNLFNRYLRGDIEAVLRQRAEAGFNLLRVWTAYDICAIGVGADGWPCQPIGRLVPREHPNFYARLPQFLQLVARHGLYVELTAFTGPYQSMFASDDEMVAHWNRLIEAVRDSTNVIVELINEHDNQPNKGLPLDGMGRPPPPIIASHGSSVRGNLPLQPYWDYATYHPHDGDDWPRRAAYSGMIEVADPGHVPVIANETTRFPDVDSSPAHAHDAAAAGALLLAGACYHSVHGKSSELWTGVELEAARAWADGARSIPLEFQGGVYVDRQEIKAQELSAVLVRRLPDGREWVVKVRH